MATRFRKAMSCRIWGWLPALIALAVCGRAGGILQIQDGYFWDPVAKSCFVPCGIAYQTWNPPVGADQTLDQIDYDLLEFKKLHVNSLRVEFTWNEVEPSPGVFAWENPTTW